MIKDDTIYLRHILDAINQIEEYVSGRDYEAFLQTRLVQDGTVVLDLPPCKDQITHILAAAS